MEVKFFDKILNFDINFENEIEESKSKFEKMNKLNTKYTSISFKFDKISNIKYIKDLKIDFNKIKKLSFYNFKDENKNIDSFFNTIISFDNIMNNLVHLSLRFFESKLIIIKIYFKKINEFKSLNYLELSEIELSENFFLKLSNLKNLQLIYCKNINIIDNINNENNNLTKLKCLGIVHCIMSKPESNLLLKCPEVESLNLSSFENE